MNRIPRTDLIVGHQTHPGETGKNNEDSYTVAAFKPPKGRGVITLAMVADGVGGNLAGEVASGMAVDTVSEYLERATDLEPRRFFTDSFEEVTRRIATYLAANPEAGNPGTTAAAALIVDRRLYTATLGDSRIYLLRSGEIRQLSIDHTAIQEAIEQGLLTPEEAEKAVAYHHIIRRYLGAQSDPLPDFRLRLDPKEDDAAAERNQGTLLVPGDIVLVCSDGLHDLVKPHEIKAALLQNNTPQKAVDALTLLARQRGGHDNITIIALQVPAIKGLRTTSAVAAIVLSIVGIIAVVLIVLGTLFLFRNDNPPPPDSSAPQATEQAPGGALPQPTATASPIPATSAPGEAPGDGNNNDRPRNTPTTELDASPTTSLDASPTSTAPAGSPTVYVTPTGTLSGAVLQTVQAQIATLAAQPTATSTSVPATSQPQAPPPTETTAPSETPAVVGSPTP